MIFSKDGRRCARLSTSKKILFMLCLINSGLMSRLSLIISVRPILEAGFA